MQSHATGFYASSFSVGPLGLKFQARGKRIFFFTLVLLLEWDPVSITGFTLAGLLSACLNPESSEQCWEAWQVLREYYCLLTVPDYISWFLCSLALPCVNMYFHVCGICSYMCSRGHVCVWVYVDVEARGCCPVLSWVALYLILGTIEGGTHWIAWAGLECTL